MLLVKQILLFDYLDESMYLPSTLLKSVSMLPRYDVFIIWCTIDQLSSSFFLDLAHTGFPVAGIQWHVPSGQILCCKLLGTLHVLLVAGHFKRQH